MAEPSFKKKKKNENLCSFLTQKEKGQICVLTLSRFVPLGQVLPFDYQYLVCVYIIIFLTGLLQ